MYYDDDADLSLLDGKTVAIIGYGSQGHAHALNLKDSGVDVVVGLREGSGSAAKASEHGLEVLPIADAASRGDLVMMLVPDELHRDVYENEVRENILSGNRSGVGIWNACTSYNTVASNTIGLDVDGLDLGNAEYGVFLWDGNDNVIGGSTSVLKQGYSRTWMETPGAGAGVPAGGLDAYCYQATPSATGKTGVRGFGGDSSGIVQTNAGTACCTAGGIDAAACQILK